VDERGNLIDGGEANGNLGPGTAGAGGCLLCVSGIREHHTAGFICPLDKHGYF
jgi:hypothetical protein